MSNTIDEISDSEFYIKYEDKINNTHLEMIKYCNENYLEIYDKNNNYDYLYDFLKNNTNLYQKIYNKNLYEEQQLYDSINYKDYSLKTLAKDISY